jgi:type IV pilus assembly protein PilW
MNPIGIRARFHQAGFTLVELMVGLAIGMLATVVIIQVMSVFDAQRRTTTGSADAQTNGGIALSAIARDAQVAGYPLFPAADAPMECTALTFGATGVASIVPVTITDGVATGTASASDKITIRYGSSPMGGAPAQITAVGATTGASPNQRTPVTIGSNLGCRVNDVVLISNRTTCTMTTVTGPGDIATPSVASTPPDRTTIELAANGDVAANAIAGANLACLGTWSEITYQVNATTGNLDRTSVVNGASTTTPSVVGVVNLQAQYGISASANSNVISQWVNASGATWGATATTPTVDNRKLIKAIRIAVVARNEKLEMSNVTDVCSSTTTAAPAPAPETSGLCAWTGSSTSPAPAIDLSPGDANWRRYRYRVYETITPIRNVIWSKGTL